jgi:hypothetical protein
MGYADFILPIRAVFLTAIISLPVATLLEFASSVRKRPLTLGHPFFTIAGLAVELFLIAIFFDEIRSFVWSIQVIQFPPFSPDVQAFSSIGLGVTIIFFLNLQRYLRPEKVGSDFQRGVLIGAMVYNMLIVPTILVFANSLELVHSSVLVSPVVILGAALLQVYLKKGS